MFESLPVIFSIPYRGIKITGGKENGKNKEFYLDDI